MALAIAMNLVWVISCYLAVKAEWRRLTLLLLPPAVIVPAYIIFKGYDLYNHVYLMKTDKYADVWKSPVYATIFFALVTRGTLLRQMWKVCCVPPRDPYLYPTPDPDPDPDLDPDPEPDLTRIILMCQGACQLRQGSQGLLDAS